jgi:hypothetical protein
MPKLMYKLYDDLDRAKAFALSFTNFAYFYDDWENKDTYTVVCDVCHLEIQHADYQMPRASAKKDTAILHSLEPGVSPALRDELIEKFDATEADFRPIRTKKGEIVYYQITPRHKLLPIHEVNEFPVLLECPHCGNIRYDQPRRENANGEPFFYITPEAEANMHDLNVTFEHFRRDFPLFVISRRLYDFLIERYPRTHYFPFYLKEDSPQ